MKFKVEIKLGNAAMLTGEDVAQALAEVADKLHQSYDDLRIGDGRLIFDYNGNDVGSWEVTR